MQLSDIDYDLPEARIAQKPIEPRDSARLLVALDAENAQHLHVRDLPSLVGPGDVIVVNDTRVLQIDSFCAGRRNHENLYYLSHIIIIGSLFQFISYG